jgi:hypothetical protein
MIRPTEDTQRLTFPPVIPDYFLNFSMSEMGDLFIGHIACDGVGVIGVILLNLRFVK